MDAHEGLRAQLVKLLERSEAHVGFDAVVGEIEPGSRGVRPAGLAHSAWEILEHIRIAQRDILEFCLDGPYEGRDWPAGYWPPTPEPPTSEAWDESVAAVRRDVAEMQRLVSDPAIDLLSVVPHGTTQTYLREALLVADHAAFHVGQLTTVRKLV